MIYIEMVASHRDFASSDSQVCREVVQRFYGLALPVEPVARCLYVLTTSYTEYDGKTAELQGKRLQQDDDECFRYHQSRWWSFRSGRHIMRSRG